MEEEIGKRRDRDRSRPKPLKRLLLGLGRGEEIDGDSPLMAEAEADLAIVICSLGDIRAGRRRQAGEIRPVSGSKWQRVVMPGEHHRLKKQRENSGRSARSAWRAAALAGWNAWAEA